jgi:hypothetical protein
MRSGTNASDNEHSGSVGNAFDFYSAGVQIESQKHRLSRLRIFVVFFSASTQMSGQNL